MTFYLLFKNPLCAKTAERGAIEDNNFALMLSGHILWYTRKIIDTVYMYKCNRSNKHQL
jgi:hypothetical protein